MTLSGVFLHRELFIERASGFSPSSIISPRSSISRCYSFKSHIQYVFSHNLPVSNSAVSPIHVLKITTAITSRIVTRPLRAFILALAITITITIPSLSLSLALPQPEIPIDLNSASNAKPSTDPAFTGGS